MPSIYVYEEVGFMYICTLKRQNVNVSSLLEDKDKDTDSNPILIKY